MESDSDRDAWDNPRCRDTADIPAPRPAPDDDTENLPETGSDSHVWCYDQHSTRGRRRRFTGHVTRIGRAEGDQLRADLAAITHDLLDWAYQQQTQQAERSLPKDGENR
jgi:hypothetical protein